MMAREPEAPGVAAPVLTGPLDISDPGGEAIYTSDRAARHYWMLSANGSTPNAAAIVAGTGAISGAYGHFDAGTGSVQVNIDFPGGIDETGAVFSIVARVEPDGDFSNVLRDTAVDVQTLPLSATYVSTMTGNAPNFGALAAGWYLAVVMQRTGTMNSITPPAQAPVTVPELSIVPAVATGNKPMRAYFVELTAPRTGAWAIGHTSGGTFATALFSLSTRPQLIASASDWANNTNKIYDFNLTVAAGDVLIGILNGHTNPLSAESATDDVTQNATANVTSAHTYRVCSGVAPASGLRDVFNDSEANFTSSSAMALAMRRAA